MTEFVELTAYWWGEKCRRTVLVDPDIPELVGDARVTVQGGYPFLGSVALHRMVMGLKKYDGLVCHHVNEDRFDARRVNLEVLPSKIAHGAVPHPLRDLTVKLAVRYDADKARQIVDALIEDRRERLFAERAA